jgi:hypothetical protein
MPYFLSPTNANSWSIDDAAAARETLVGPFASGEERSAAVQRYNAIKRCKRDSGWELPSKPC